MSVLSRILNGITSAFQYDATKAEGKRRPPSGKTHSEDAILTSKDRAKVQSVSRDLVRNFTLAGWMIRRHLDYVVPHSFHSRSGDSGFDREFEAMIGEWSKRGAFEVTERFTLCEYARLLESCATIDGDCGSVKIDDGRVQGVESDRIRDPEKKEGGDWCNGVLKGPAGAPIGYGVWGRNPEGKGYKWERTVPAESLFLHGTYGRFDQYRCVSPMTAGLNSLQDVYEGISLSLSKLKVEQLFALAFYRDAEEPAGEVNDTAAVDDEGDTETNKAGYKVDFGRGPVVLDLEDGDRAEFLKSDSPGGNSQAFLMAVIQVSMKALDLPFSFYDEAHTNFFGSRAAWLHYERSCQPKRERVKMFLDDWTLFRVLVALRSGEIVVPAALDLMRPWWEWVPQGMPWWQPNVEIKGDTDAIRGGFTNPQRVVRERGGGDFYRNIEETAKAIDYAKGFGIVLSFDDAGAAKLKQAAKPLPTEGANV